MRIKLKKTLKLCELRERKISMLHPSLTLISKSQLSLTKYFMNLEKLDQIQDGAQQVRLWAGPAIVFPFLVTFLWSPSPLKLQPWSCRKTFF
jgi:hypothetical protein